MLWKMGMAIGDFAAGFVFSTRVWAGIAVAGLAVVLFIASGPLRRRSVRRAKAPAAAAGGQDTRPLPRKPVGAVGAELSTRPETAAPAKARRGKSAADDDDDLGDVADILRRHGIT
jgi:hypothetical protein